MQPEGGFWREPAAREGVNRGGNVCTSGLVRTKQSRRRLTLCGRPRFAWLRSSANRDFPAHALTNRRGRSQSAAPAISVPSALGAIHRALYCAGTGLATFGPRPRRRWSGVDIEDRQIEPLWIATGLPPMRTTVEAEHHIYRDDAVLVDLSIGPAHPRAAEI